MSMPLVSFVRNATVIATPMIATPGVAGGRCGEVEIPSRT
jgi:hypothetical protein